MNPDDVDDVWTAEDERMERVYGDESPLSPAMFGFLSDTE